MSAGDDGQDGLGTQEAQGAATAGAAAVDPAQDAGRASQQPLFRHVPEPHEVSARWVPADSIRAWAAQPRRKLSEATMKELARSIEQNGILQPVLVRPVPGEPERWEVIAGERRWRAAVMAGRKDVPVIIREATDGEALILGLVENLQREDLNIMDRARALRRLYEQLGSWGEVGQAVGFGEARIDSMVKPLTERRMFQINALNELPQPIQAALEEGEINEKHGRALGRMKDDETQTGLFGAIKENQLSGPETERLLRLIKEEEEYERAREGTGPLQGPGAGNRNFPQHLQRAVDTVRTERIRVVPQPRVMRSLYQRISDTASELTRLLDESRKHPEQLQSDDTVVRSMGYLTIAIRDWKQACGLQRRLPALPPGVGEEE